MGKHESDNESDENQTPTEKRRVERAEQERKRVIAEPSSKAIFNWIERLFWADDDALDAARSGWPQRIVLTVALGATGTRLGPCVMDVPFAYKKDKEKPNRERIVELSNEFLAAAQSDCDALGRPTRYALSAYDSRRSDRSYSRLLLKVAPSGVSTALEMERGVGVGALDDEEGNALSTKLVAGLLLDERRDRRWSQEMMANVMSSALERADLRNDRLEQMIDGTWQKMQAMMLATETMLSQANERRLAQEFAAWKKEKLSLAIDKALSLGELLLPALAGGDANSDGNPIQKLLASMSEDEGALLFGQLSDDRTRASGAVFSSEQFTTFVKIANAKTPDASDVAALASSITPDQIENAKSILGLGRLVPLYKWLMAQPTNGAAVQ